MKITKITLLLAVCSIGLFTGCAEDNKPLSKDQVVGNWLIEEFMPQGSHEWQDIIEEDFVLQLRNDDIFQIREKTAVIEEGIYELSGKTIILKQEGQIFLQILSESISTTNAVWQISDNASVIQGRVFIGRIDPEPPTDE